MLKGEREGRRGKEDQGGREGGREGEREGGCQQVKNLAMPQYHLHDLDSDIIIMAIPALEQQCGSEPREEAPVLLQFGGATLSARCGLPIRGCITRLQS